MSTINLGRILPMFKGTYNPEITYSKLDIVYYNGSSYVSITTNKGYVPTNASRWQIIALKGSWASFTESEKAEVINSLNPLLEALAEDLVEDEKTERENADIILNGEISYLNNKVDSLPSVSNSSDSDLDIADDSGKVLAQFKDGHFKIKNFDSRNAVKQSQIDALNDSLNDRFSLIHDDIDTLQSDIEEIDTKIEHPVKTFNGDSDLDISDDNGNVLVRCNEGNIATKNFNSASIEETNLSPILKSKINSGGGGSKDLSVQTYNEGTADFYLSDDNGNVLLELEDGNIKTKNFDSSSTANKEVGFIPDILLKYHAIGDSITAGAGTSVGNRYFELLE